MRDLIESENIDIILKKAEKAALVSLLGLLEMICG